MKLTIRAAPRGPRAIRKEQDLPTRTRLRTDRITNQREAESIGQTQAAPNQFESNIRGRGDQ